MSDHSKRIISHMNKDHQLALVDYVVVYGKVPLQQLDAKSVQITAVDEKTLTISFKRNGRVEELSLVWNDITEDEHLQVNALPDVKNKLVSMAKYAANAQGYSHKQLKKVSLPTKPLQIFMYFAGVAILIGSIDKHWFRRVIAKDAFLSRLAAQAPSFVKSGGVFLEEYVKTIGVAMYAVHIVEILLVSLPKLRKYRASGSRKLAWSTMHFFEGFLIFKRLNKALENA